MPVIISLQCQSGTSQRKPALRKLRGYQRWHCLLKILVHWLSCQSNDFSAFFSHREQVYRSVLTLLWPSCRLIQGQRLKALNVELARQLAFSEADQQWHLLYSSTDFNNGSIQNVSVLKNILQNNTIIKAIILFNSYQLSYRRNNLQWDIWWRRVDKDFQNVYRWPAFDTSASHNTGVLALALQNMTDNLQRLSNIIRIMDQALDG